MNYNDNFFNRYSWPVDWHREYSETPKPKPKVDWTKIEAYRPDLKPRRI